MPGLMLLIYRKMAISYSQTCSFLIQQVYSFTTGSPGIGNQQEKQAAGTASNSK